jgi:hypothetical protein
MPSKKRKPKKFNGMSYREIQRANSSNRKTLDIEAQKYLKKNGYKNVGWDNVISLYQKIEELSDEVTLEDLFLEADRIGNKYLTAQEISEANQSLSKVLNEIDEEIDKKFLDTEIEIIDFRKKKTH